MSELIVNNPSIKCLRFQCECNDPRHCMDVWIKSINGIAMNFTMYDVILSGPAKFPLKVVTAIRYVFGLPLTTHSFTLKKSDVQDLINYLNESKVIDIMSSFIGVGAK